jgi:Tol biopolymer transport system component
LRNALLPLLVIGLPLAHAGVSLGPSPRGFEGTLAFQSDRHGREDIFRITFNGAGRPTLRRLTNDPADDGGPAWSPTGDRLAFHSNRSGNYDLYLMDADGSNLRRLTDHPADEGQPNWSPDGRWIAFEGERDGRAEIYRLKVDSGRVRRLTHGLKLKLGPAHAPDGRKIAFMEKGPITWQVALLDIASGETKTLTSGGGNCRPAWSPDGRLLAVVSTRQSRRADIWLMEVERDASWMLRTRPDAYNYDPSFSPDGRAIAFATTLSRDQEDWDIYLSDINGRQVSPLTSGPGNDRFPVWRP